MLQLKNSPLFINFNLYHQKLCHEDHRNGKRALFILSLGALQFAQWFIPSSSKLLMKE